MRISEGLNYSVGVARSLTVADPEAPVPSTPTMSRNNPSMSAPSSSQGPDDQYSDDYVDDVLDELLENYKFTCTPELRVKFKRRCLHCY